MYVLLWMNICIILLMVVLMSIIWLKDAMRFCTRQLRILGALLALLIAAVLMVLQENLV